MRTRLKSLASMVPEVKRVIDVGCDHALLDIYLAESYVNTSFLAIDISKKALENALNNVLNSSLESRIKVVLNDGLKDITLNSDDFIVISGLGTNTIIDIISLRISEINNVLIQSNRDLEYLRKYMFDNGFKIVAEKVIFDGNYYVFIHFQRGKFIYKKEDLWLGPLIKESKNDLYFKFLLKKYKKILPGIPDNDLKRLKIENHIKLLEKLLKKSGTTII